MELLKPHHLYQVFIVVAMTLNACEAPPPPQGHFETQTSIFMGGQEQNQADDEARKLSYQSALDGDWVLFSQVSTCVDIGSSLEQYNRSLYLIHVTQSAHGGLTEVWEACEIDLTPVISVRAQIPEALRQSVYPLETRRGQVVGTPPEQRYTSGALLELWGVVMDEPLIDAMPTTPADERLFDMDEDGEAGVTLQIGDACMAYMAQRRITHYHGQMIAPDRIEGEALSVTEQYIIDASAPICKTSYQIRSNPARSHFSRVRVDGRGGAINLDINGDEKVDCTEVQAARNQLFVETLILIELDHDACSIE
jgi:hypothetical protein